MPKDEGGGQGVVGGVATDDAIAALRNRGLVVDVLYTEDELLAIKEQYRRDAIDRGAIPPDTG